jgi:hypothetical protein
VVKLIVPPGQEPALASFLSYSEDEANAFLDAVERVRPTGVLASFARQVAKATRLSENDVRGVVGMLAGLYASRELLDVSVELFVSAVCRAMEAVENESLRPVNGDWEPFTARLTRALSMHKTIGAAAKAASLVYGQRPLVLQAARILTDLRPVFPSGTAETPVALTVIHTLKLEYYDTATSMPDQLFLAVDLSDIRNLASTLERAMEKDKSLRAIVNEGKVPLLDTEE